METRGKANDRGMAVQKKSRGQSRREQSGGNNQPSAKWKRNYQTTWNWGKLQAVLELLWFGYCKAFVGGSRGAVPTNAAGSLLLGLLLPALLLGLTAGGLFAPAARGFRFGGISPGLGGPIRLGSRWLTGRTRSNLAAGLLRSDFRGRLLGRRNRRPHWVRPSWRRAGPSRFVWHKFTRFF